MTEPTVETAMGTLRLVHTINEQNVVRLQRMVWLSAVIFGVTGVVLGFLLGIAVMRFWV